MICDDDEKFYYRSSSKLTEFFQDCDLPFTHDGTTRAHWVNDVLVQLNAESGGPLPSNEIARVILGVLDLAYIPEKALPTAVEDINSILKREGLTVYRRDDGQLDLRTRSTFDDFPTLTLPHQRMRPHMPTNWRDQDLEEIAGQLPKPVSGSPVWAAWVAQARVLIRTRYPDHVVDFDEAVTLRVPMARATVTVLGGSVPHAQQRAEHERVREEHVRAHYHDEIERVTPAVLSLLRAIDRFSTHERVVPQSLPKTDARVVLTDKPPCCFLSYAWETEEHNEWVLKLATSLTEKGVHVRLDKWDLVAGRDLAQYMEESVRESDYVLMVCTEAYAEKANARTGGVGYEQTIISGQVFEQVAQPEKFVPILRGKDRQTSIPSYFKPKLFIDFRDDNQTNNFEELLRHVFREPKHCRPPMGPRPNFSP